MTAVLPPSSDADAAFQLVLAWAVRDLAPELDEALRLAVTHQPPWRALYRAALRIVLGDRSVSPQAAPPCRILRSPAGLEAFSEPVRTVRLPHRSALARLVITQEPGVIVARAGSTEARATLASGRIELHIDDIAGAVTIPFEAVEAGFESQLDDVASALAEGAREVVDVAATHFVRLATPQLLAADRTARAALLRLEDADKELEDRVARLLEIRLGLEGEVLGWSDEAARSLWEADRALWHCRWGVMVLDASRYYDLLGLAGPALPEAWWTWRALVEARVGPDRVDALLLEDARQSLLASVRSWLAGLAGALETLVARDRPVSVGVALALGAAPSPASAGRVLIPVVLDDGRGALITLAIRLLSDGDPTPPWARTGLLKPVALDACRAAYFAACRTLPSHAPPAPFDLHAFEIEGDVVPRALDGGSLAAGAVVAFLSLWTGMVATIPGAITGTVQGDRVRLVGGLEQKLDACAGGRLVLPEDQLDDALESAGVRGVALARVATIDQLLRAVGLDLPSEASWRPWIGGTADRMRRIRSMALDVEEQRLADYRRADENPWVVLADRLHAALESFGVVGARHRDEIAAARAWCAIAYQHAVEPDLAAAMLRGIELSPSAPVALRALADVAALGSRIQLTIAEGAWAIDARLDAMRPDLEATRPWIHGAVMGTRGRLRMHERRPSEALPLLEEAVRLHDIDAPHEAPRSRIYLAMACRMADEAERALTLLDEARAGIARELAPEHAPYAATTSVYLEYELARVLLDLDRADDAIIAARHADACAEALGLLWPRQGILRTLAWSLRSAGRDEGGVLDALERFSQLPEFAAEARGPRRGDGIVY